MVNINRLSNKVARVTGASKGIGGGIATALGAAGARVAVNYSSDREGAERVAQAIKRLAPTAVASYPSSIAGSHPWRDPAVRFHERRHRYTDKGIGARTCAAQDPGERHRSRSYRSRRQLSGGSL
ncbi:MAG: SDR family NAD(P)-dependent oxidoreductase [Candidatus Sulfotelmatobacter sp.]